MLGEFLRQARSVKEAESRAGMQFDVRKRQLTFDPSIGEDKANMSAANALLQDQIRSILGSRCEAAFLLEKRPANETLPSPVSEIPRGALTEIAGPVSSGRTSLLYSLLAAASSGQEFCALLDTENSFDPESAQLSGVRLAQVLWVRCCGNAEHALKSADMLAQAGGFGLVAVDLGDIPEKVMHRIPLAAWFRLRHAVENTRTALVVVARQIHARSCSALKIDLRRKRALWKGQFPGRLLDGIDAVAECTRNHHTHQQPLTIRR